MLQCAVTCVCYLHAGMCCQLSVQVACHLLYCLPERQLLTRKSTLCYENKFQVCLKLLAKHSGIQICFLARAQMAVTIGFCVNS